MTKNRIFLIIVFFLFSSVCAKTIEDTIVFSVQVEEVCQFDLCFYNDFYSLDSLAHTTCNREEGIDITYYLRINVIFDSEKQIYIANTKLLFFKFSDRDSQKYYNEDVLSFAKSLQVAVISKGVCNIEKIHYTIPVLFSLKK